MDKDKKAPPEGWNFDTTELIFILLIFAMLIGTIVPAVLSYIKSGEISFFGTDLTGLKNFIGNISWIFKALGFIIAGAAATATFVFNKLADGVVRTAISELYPKNTIVDPSPVINGEVDATKTKWQKIIDLVESTEESNWRLAVIEADIMLDSLLEKLNLPGQTIGDKLKAVEPSDFTTIDYAWEAHKARNNIAHQGSDFMFNQREARRIISLYGAVFKEFYLI